MLPDHEDSDFQFTDFSVETDCMKSLRRTALEVTLYATQYAVSYNNLLTLSFESIVLDGSPVHALPTSIYLWWRKGLSPYDGVMQQHQTQAQRRRGTQGE